MKKKYDSTKICRDRYNKENSTIQISRKLVESVKELLNGSISLKEFIESAIIEKIDGENIK